MKKIDMFCASQASTAICMSMDRPSSSSSTIQPGGPTIDRCNPVIREQKRIPRTRPLVPCTSQPPPINPVPYQLLHKSQKSTSKNKASDQNSNKKSNSTKPKPKPNDQKNKKISFKPADIDDGDKKSAASLNVPKYIVRKSWAKPGGSIIAPPGSSRNLLGDAAFVDGIPDYDPVSAQLVPVEPNMSTQALSKEESTASRPSSSSSPNQVVVLRVSLHCKGCEGKVRKHLSRMEGMNI
ncbi:protein SODIUM POTASSIUM ROOT DEFECTIVE 2-like [Populus alba x Populus x berolinensis]|uniref:Protein SODIUM POTASSIUM ROOT DEFECTIVE 2-like n=1 Tax=Populus alba x Populus x berolinensis TaxID=444605 RepID=A0AAD6LK62_9ROSI|nr:protein SODIUM POTASSIUM ROOT DEFECTIVE 2-like [Populus alba x Populus x berolinensis]